MDDTSPDIRKKMMQMLARRSGAERMKMASSMFDAAKSLVAAGLQNGKKPLSRAQLRAQTFVRMYGDCFTREEIGKIMERVPDMEWEGNKS